MRPYIWDTTTSLFALLGAFLFGLRVFQAEDLDGVLTHYHSLGFVAQRQIQELLFERCKTHVVGAEEDLLLTRPE